VPVCFEILVLMRMTVALDTDVEILVRQFMAEHGLSLEAAVNEALRRGLGSDAPTYAIPVHHLGEPAFSLDRALAVACSLEDQAIVDELEQHR
jgi:hypothetical protein